MELTNKQLIDQLTRMEEMLNEIYDAVVEEEELKSCEDMDCDFNCEECGLSGLNDTDETDSLQTETTISYFVTYKNGEDHSWYSDAFSTEEEAKEYAVYLVQEKDAYDAKVVRKTVMDEELYLIDADSRLVDFLASLEERVKNLEENNTLNITYNITQKDINNINSFVNDLNKALNNSKVSL